MRVVYVIIFALIAASMNVCAASQATVQAKPKIVIVESYSRDFAWDASYRNVLIDRLGNVCDLSFFEMNTKKLPASMHKEMGQKAMNFIRETHPDLVVLGDDTALKFLGNTLEDLHVKTVYLGINNNPRAYFPRGNPVYVTGVLERPLVRRSVFYVRKIIPGVNKILILFDTDVTSNIILEDEFSGKKTGSIGNINYEIKLLGHASEWGSEIVNAKQNGYGAIIIGLFQTIKDKTGHSVDPTVLLSWSSTASTVPTFAFWDFSVGEHGAIGGFVLSGAEQGRNAANIIELLLKNPDLLPGEIEPIFQSDGVLLFSKKQLSKWHIAC
jgi:ABC-type uncharacterized transport system substrate-binding protein